MSEKTLLANLNAAIFGIQIKTLLFMSAICCAFVLQSCASPGEGIAQINKSKANKEKEIKALNNLAGSVDKPMDFLQQLQSPADGQVLLVRGSLVKVGLIAPGLATDVFSKTNVSGISNDASNKWVQAVQINAEVIKATVQARQQALSMSDNHPEEAPFRQSTFGSSPDQAIQKLRLLLQDAQYGFVIKHDSGNFAIQV